MNNLENMSLVDQLYAIKNMLEDEMSVLGYSKNTIGMYLKEIDHFINFCVKYDGEIQYNEIIRPIIMESIQYREKQSQSGKISANTKEIFIKAVRRLFKYIEENIDTEKNYMKMFSKIKIQKETKEMKYLTDEEIKRFLDVLERNKSKPSYVNIRNVLLAKLLLFGGLRISEALNLKIDDFKDANSGSVYKIEILGKGNKEASVYIRKDFISDEINTLKEKMINKEGYIFVTKKNRLITTREARVAIERFYRKAHIFKHGLHILRHTLAMKLIRDGVDIVHIQKILRHSSISTTTIYAHSTEKDVVGIAKGLMAVPIKVR